MANSNNDKLKIVDGAKIAVLGGGPAGSFFSIFALDMASRSNMEIAIDVYEPKDFTKPGPASCNMCGGIISESLVQLLATEGINLPSSSVQRGLDSYILHIVDEDPIRINTPVQEKRIAAVHRGGGPRGVQTVKWDSFDGVLQEMSVQRGATVIPKRVNGVSLPDGKPVLAAKGMEPKEYDLLVVAAGVNTAATKLFSGLNLTYQPPKTGKTYICEFNLGQELVDKHFGTSMHVFLMNMPHLEFSALIPKGEYVTLCLLGDEISKELVTNYLNSKEVRSCFPDDWEIPEDFCKCMPKICTKEAVHPYADRIVFIGDCGVSRLYKDGIGAAYRTAKAAAVTAIFKGIADEDFKKHFWPVCKKLKGDNFIGHFVFMGTGIMQKFRFARRAILRMVWKEQTSPRLQPRMSSVLWDTFTGSAPYMSIFKRTLHPVYLARLLGNMAMSIRKTTVEADTPPQRERKETLGRLYRAGEFIVKEGELGDCMYVIQKGRVEVLKGENTDQAKRLAILTAGDFFGEMALFEKVVRSASVRAIGDVEALAIDRKTIMRRIHEDSSLVFRIMIKMSTRIRDLNDELYRIHQDDSSK